MRLVLDTNVYLAALISHGHGYEVLERCALRHCLIVSDFILTEVQEKLHDKFHWSSTDIARAVSLFTTRSIRVVPVELVLPVCRDRDDDAILGTALAGNAVTIVTGDSDLLVLDGYRALRIVAPGAFWELEHAAERDRTSA